MSESKLSKFLEYAHHMYWIGELLLFLGAGKLVIKILAIHIPDPDIKTAIWLICSALLFYSFQWAMKLWRGRSGIQRQGSKGQAITGPAIVTTASPIDVNKILEKNYIGALQAETETNIRDLITSIPAAKREELSIRLYASGAIAYGYDSIWWVIFKSQILALEALNKRVLRREQLKDYYESATREYAQEYASFTFESWSRYLFQNTLVLELPGDSIGITVRGKDFLKYLVHWGHSVNDRRL